MNAFSCVCNAGCADRVHTGYPRNRYLCRAYRRMMIARRNGDIALF